MLYSNLNKIFCLLAALLSPSIESKSPLSDTDSNPKSPASYKKPVRPSLSIVFSRSNNKTDHTATLLTKPYLFSISFDNTQSTATISVHKPVTSQTKTAHLTLPQDNSLSAKITKPSLISMTFDSLESTTIAPQSKPDVFSLSLNYDQSNATESSKKTLALSNESVSRTITTESVHNKSEVEKETLKNDPRTTPEARRQYGQFGQPALRPPSDPEIAQLLNEYKSMVSKYHYEEEQKIQDNIPFQDANVEPFSMNQKGYIQRQNLGYLGLRGATEMPSQGYRGVRPGGPGGNVPGRQGPGGHGPGGQGPGGQGPGGQGPGGQGPGGHEGPGGQGPGGHEGPGGHGPGGQGPGGHGPGGQGPGGHGPGGPGGPNTTPNEDAMAVATRFTTQRTTTRRRRRTAPKRWTFDENCDYTAYYCLRAFNTGSVCGKTIYYNHMTFKNYCMIEYVNCMERYDDYEYDNDDFLDRDYMVEDM